MAGHMKLRLLNGTLPHSPLAFVTVSYLIL